MLLVRIVVNCRLDGSLKLLLKNVMLKMNLKRFLWNEVTMSTMDHHVFNFYAVQDFLKEQEMMDYSTLEFILERNDPILGEQRLKVIITSILNLHLELLKLRR